MKTEVLNVTGMTCGGCVASVRRALTALPGIAGVVVSLPRQQAEIQFDESKLTVDAIRTALQRAGYDVAAAPTGAEHRGGCCCAR
jgi:copper chaperone